MRFILLRIWLFQYIFYTSWGQEFTAGAAVVIWLIIWGSLDFSIFSRPVWMENYFSSSIIVCGDLLCNFFSWGDSGSNENVFASWGWELTLEVAVVIWVIIRGWPLLLVFSIFSGPIIKRIVSLFSSCNHISAMRLLFVEKMVVLIDFPRFLGSIYDFGSGRINLGNNLRFTGITFHIFWTCLNEKLVILFCSWKRSSPIQFILLIIWWF